MKFLLLFAVMALVIGCQSQHRNGELTLPSRILPLRQYAGEPEARLVRYYQPGSSFGKTNLIMQTWEERIRGRWRLVSRSYYLDGILLLEEYDLDSHGRKENVILHANQKVFGIRRSASGPPVLMNQGEFDEIMEARKLGERVGKKIIPAFHEILERVEGGEMSGEELQELMRKVLEEEK